MCSKRFIVSILLILLLNVEILHGFAHVVGPIIALSGILIALHMKLNGDGVAIGIANQFIDDAAILRRVDNYYIPPNYGVSEKIGDELIRPKTGGTGGAFDDGDSQFGGSAGLVRYSVTDPTTKIKYCLDIMWGQEFNIDIPTGTGSYIRKVFEGFAVIIGHKRCSDPHKTAFDQYAAALLHHYQSGTGKTFGAFRLDSRTSRMVWKERAYTRNKLTFNSVDNKITIVADMSNKEIADIKVNIGPTNWNVGHSNIYDWKLWIYQVDIFMFAITIAVIVLLLFCVYGIVIGFIAYKLGQNRKKIIKQEIV